VIAVEQQSARTEHGGQFGVHGPQIVLGQPMQGGGADRRVRGPGQVQPGRPAGFAQVQVNKTEPGPAGVGGLAQRQRHRVGVDADDGGARQPVEQPDGQRAGAAAEVEDQRVRAPGSLFDRVDQGREPVLAIRQALLLLAIPALDPVQCGVAVKFRHAGPPCS
jgi:hypothetical protein